MWLHIGHFKTGTTAIQVFSEDNETAMRRRGVNYARSARWQSKHSRFAFSVYRKAGVSTLMHGYDHAYDPTDVWNELFAEVMADSAPATLISSEEFMRLGAHPAAEDILSRIIAPWRDRIDFRVIAWLRPVDDHLRSWYNQLVKMGIPVPGFNAAVTSVMEPVHYDYGQAIAPWVRLFGPEAVCLRPYSRDFRNGLTLYEDFLDQIGLDPDLAARWRSPGEDVNPRLDDRMTEIVRLSQQMGLTADQRNWFMDRINRARKQEADLQRSPRKAETQVVAECLAGMAALADLPGNGLDLAAMRAAVPAFDDPEIEQLTFALKVALREIVFTRRHMTQIQEKMWARLQEIEKRLPGKTPEA